MSRLIAKREEHIEDCALFGSGVLKQMNLVTP